jgi:two-component system, NarL family, nitrate/nitrite response regulator NarL
LPVREDSGAGDAHSILTGQEQEVLRMVADGKTNREIARLTNRSVSAVDLDLTEILKKLHLKSLREMILYALKTGLR